MTLPSSVVPNHYSIQINPKFSDFTFSGRETITVQILQKTKTIVLNSVDIEIQRASFVSNTDNDDNGEIS